MDGFVNQCKPVSTFSFPLALFEVPKFRQNCVVLLLCDCFFNFVVLLLFALVLHAVIVFFYFKPRAAVALTKHLYTRSVIFYRSALCMLFYFSHYFSIFEYLGLVIESKIKKYGLVDAEG